MLEEVTFEFIGTARMAYFVWMPIGKKGWRGGGGGAMAALIQI